MKRLGIDSEILSGDSLPAVTSVAQRCGIKTFLARRSPAQKLARVDELRASGHSIAMVGDGINDAPVLGASDVSIAMGRGAALAMATADLVLVNERLTSISEAIRIAHKTMRIARQNLFWAAAYNLSALPLAAFGLVPPWLAAIGMSASSVAVVLNAMRLAPASGGAKRRIQAQSASAERGATSATSPRSAPLTDANVGHSVSADSGATL